MPPLRTLLAVLLALGSAPRLTAAPPNVVFILADDLGWTDLGCQGSTYYRTPHLDRMAAEGLRFTSGYTCGPNCQPTRAALMSGRYAPRTGVYTVGGIDRFDWKSRPLRPVDNVQTLDPKIPTVAEALKAAGYRTALFGKWHLGQDAAHHPLARGFDEGVVSMGKHFGFATTPKAEVPEGAYLADWLTDRAVDFIGRHADRPFFLCLHHFGVHSPHEAKPELVAKFKGSPTAGGHRDPVYAAMIASVDESVGRVLAALDERKLSANTLVIFTSDNGGVGGSGFERDRDARLGGITDNAPLRAGKGSLYEGGVRVPYLARWPGRVAPGVTDEPINSVDLFPTLLELSGAARPAGVLDGVSYLPTLLGKPRDRGPLFWHFPGYLGAARGHWRTTPAGSVRHGDWKLIEFFEDGRRELYNLKDDPGERHDRAAAVPDRAKELHATLAAWRTSVGAKMPTANR